jgi:ribonuclease R
VQLDALFIEGLVHVTDLGADYFQFDDARHELRGERTGIRYQLTDKVTVQVSRVDLDARKIDLRLVNEPAFRTILKNEARRAEAEQSREKKSKARAAAKPKEPSKSSGKKTAKTAKTSSKRSASSSNGRSASRKSYAKTGKKKR